MRLRTSFLFLGLGSLVLTGACFVSSFDVGAGGAGATPSSSTGVGGGSAGAGAGGSDGAEPCVTATDCAGTDDECRKRVCTDGICGSLFSVSGTNVFSQTTGDCKKKVCDGTGSVIEVVDDSDVLDDGKECTDETCQGGVLMVTMEPPDTTCGSGDTHCDGLGNCVGCTAAADCGSSTACFAFDCTNAICEPHSVNDGAACGSCKTCSAGTCTNAPVGTVDSAACSAQDVSTCGLDGKCDGSGACEKWPVGSVCAASTCATGTQKSYACNAAGTCAITFKQCDAYACGGTTCNTSCTQSPDCAASYECLAGACENCTSCYSWLIGGMTFNPRPPFCPDAGFFKSATALAQNVRDCFCQQCSSECADWCNVIGDPTATCQQCMQGACLSEQNACTTDIGVH